MAELNLDYQPNFPFPWGGSVLLGIAVVALVMTGIYFHRLSGQVSVLEAKVERANSRASLRESSARGAVELAEEVKNANDALRHLGVPWESLFHAVESSGNQSITLLAIEPDIEKQQVKISGEARSFNALMNYITHLQGQAVLGSVYLQNHDVQQEDPDKSVRFSLIASWKDRS
jgi:Tfp pilus assembly protein PilN